ncbi:MAG: alanine--tRNA ligase [Parcubacteria group bacterium]|nr:alanine--tRNA ligase [Parcubacteria group bacterium]
MNANEIRAKYLKFFEERGHTVIPSAPLVPQNDPTTLFTGSGMQPLVPYLLGKEHPEGARLVNSQKCFRAMDIEEVGDNRHTTFFEMLGNWSLGDYFKKEQLPWFFEFLTKEAGIPKEKLWVTCFEGDEKFNLPKDTESAEIWESLGVAEDHIKFYGSKKNWWSRAGVPENMPVGEPGGPDSEVFYDFGEHRGLHEQSQWKDEPCHPNCDCGRFMEIGNSVFMQYIKKEDGSFGLLPKQNVDFGGGLERITAAANNEPDVFQVDLFVALLSDIERITGTSYTDHRQEFRVIADHIRAAVFLIGDGVDPSNKDQGYFVRRLIRRAAVRLNKLKTGAKLEPLVRTVLLCYKEQFDAAESGRIDKKVADEEIKFAETLTRGLKELEKGTDAFTLFTTYGFPIELTRELAAEKGIAVDEEGFKQEMAKHQELSRAGSEQKFKGGLADTSEKTTRLHTAHHLLLKALQMVLGPEVKQRGSNITQERLRIDFNYGQKVTLEQLAEVEKIVNEKIKEDLPVIHTEMPKDEAEKLGAEHEFGAKYPDRVSVYSVGALDNAFSIEFCGGPHVTHTGELGTFKIQKEEASSAGIRRIKAVLQ